MFCYVKISIAVLNPCIFRKTVIITPSRYSYSKSKRLFGSYFNTHPAVRHIRGCYFYISRTGFEFSADILMNIHRVFIFSYTILAYRRKKPCQIRRTAGTTEPLLSDGFDMLFSAVFFASFGQNFQRIDIKEPVALMVSQ